MTKSNKRAIARFVMFILTITVLLATLHTIAIGIDLAMISEENSKVETWRINPMGSEAANSVYNKNAEIRDSIYNSDFWYTSWISKANTLVQLFVGFGLIAFSSILIYMWYLIIQSDIKRMRKRQAIRRKMHSVPKNGQTV